MWKSETSPNQGTWLGIPWMGLVSLCQIWDFYGYSLRWLDTVFQGQYPPSLRINYVAINKVLEKLPPQLY